MYIRNVRLFWMLAYRHENQFSRFKLRVDIGRKKGNVDSANSVLKLSAQSNCEPILSRSSNMIKLTPLSGLIKDDNSMKEGESADSEKHTDETCTRDPKHTVLPSNLLSNVAQTVKMQVEKGEFINPDPKDPDPLVIKHDTTSTNTGKQLDEDSESLRVYHDGNDSQVETEDNKSDERRNSEGSDVYDISVLFSEKFDRAYRKSAKKATRKSGKKRKKEALNEENNDEEDIGESKKKKQKKVMPNYFIAIQITNPKVHEGLRSVQQSVENQSPSLTAAMIPLPTLHITLLVMHLANDEEIERAKTVLKHCGRKLCDTRDSQITLGISGIGHFGNNVVFAKVVPDSQLDTLNSIADVVTETFRENEVNLAGEKGFKPHITIMKLSRSPKLRKKGIKKIDSKYYSDHLNATFGTQTIESLQLCSMLAPKDEKGYYHVVYAVPWCEATQNSENMFTVEMENEIKWKFTAGPVPQPVEPTEEERESLFASLHSNVRKHKPEELKLAKTRTHRHTMLKTETKPADIKSKVSSLTKLNSGSLQQKK